MNLFGELRSLAYLKRISISLERIADAVEAQTGYKPKNKRKSEPKAEVYKPTVSDWNQRYREEHPALDHLDADE